MKCERASPVHFSSSNSFYAGLQAWRNPPSPVLKTDVFEKTVGQRFKYRTSKSWNSMAQSVPQEA
ncbi:MAG: hypothetical protein JWQ87_973 [Candidatus Sulfotelmatobacter sp.]|nr:hypothetical protein [Candidatus Sulfotelmatobacter sp.]